ncbi:MAG: GTPase HflX [Dehalococcoidia bacterium]|nr:GTPase HflX [Dehalococcoidia bacterium]
MPVTYETAAPPERALLVAVGEKSNGHQGFTPEESLTELAQLVETAGAEVVGEVVQRLDRPHPAHYVGKGKLGELTALKQDAGYSMVLFDDELSPSQQRNLENALKVKVLDRTALILDIFAQRASTREARLQVELAQTEYLLPRLAGQWSHLERLEGAIGTRGPGETQIETDRRLVRTRVSRLKREIQSVRKQRDLYRRRRQRAGVPVVSLVGYTNAGKSTLMRALSGAKVLAEDRLFATLDPVTRRINLPVDGFGQPRPVLLTDTVGFIQKLPTQLVAAFRATLEELREADVLLHVVDITHPNAAEQSAVVEATLRELDVLDRPTITVLNKVDRFQRSDGAGVNGLEDIDELRDLAGMEGRRICFVSAARGWGLDTLRRAIADLT